MKNKIIKSVFLSLLLILFIAPQTMAMEIIINPNGSINFYQGRVLGEISQANRVGNSTRAVTQQKAQTRTDRPVKTLDAVSGKRVDVRTSGNDRDTYTLEVRDSSGPYITPSFRPDTNPQEINFETKETIDGEDLTISLPADKPSRLETEERLEYFREAYSQRNELQSLSEEERESRIEERQEQYETYITRLQEQRQERAEERIEIRNNNEDEGFEIQSRNRAANIRGADFSYDQETGEVILTTPSGNERILQHLPDQAIERMSENGFFIDESQEVDIETGEDGRILYTAPSSRQKRLFGLFTRNVPTEVRLDDLTGEITEQEVPSENPLGRLLNSFTF